MKELLRIYHNEFIPAYSDVVGYLAYKPIEILVEMEHVFSHLMKYENSDLDSNTREENLKKARDHLYRGTLDCYKILWSEMDVDIDRIAEDDKLRKFAVNMPEGEFMDKFNSFKDKAMNARRMEMENVGEAPTASLEIYKEAVGVGNELLENIDRFKLYDFDTHMRSMKRFVTAKEYLLGILTGFIGTVIATFLFFYFGYF